MATVRGLRGLGLVLVVLVGLLVAIPALHATPRSVSSLPTPLTTVAAGLSPSNPSEFTSSPAAAFPYTELGRGVPGAVLAGAAPSTSLRISVTLDFSNSSRLSTLLKELQDPSSAQYHHYLTAASFDSEFGRPASEYSAAVAYFREAGVSGLTTYSDHLTISFQASTSLAARLFHTSIGEYHLAGRSFVAPTSAPRLPGTLGAIVSGVDGLSTYSALTNHILSHPPTIRGTTSGLAPRRPAQVSGYLTPVGTGTSQLEFAPDFQVAYDELSLFATEGYPTGAVIATVLWSGVSGVVSSTTTACGTLAPGQNVGPFDPNDVYSFFNQTLPSGQPHPTIGALPVDGAPWPGCFAGYDGTSAFVENTLDLEMSGSMAPGATLINAYGATNTNVDLDDAFTNILSPNGSAPTALANVSVITNSWGGTDAFDAGWNASTAQANARGITVLAASGDSGSNPNGANGGLDAPPQVTFLPASMAFDSYGVVAVGGTTVTLDPTTLLLTGDIVWNETALCCLGIAAGSTGGISAIYSAPSWQNTTEANSVIAGAGRGVPDIAAIANNTVLTITASGYQYQAGNATTGNPYQFVAGTSISSPLVAGLIAESDYVLSKLGDGWLGFLDPLLYPLASTQYTPVPPYDPLSPTGFIPTGAYNTTLPTLPFYDVTIGRNFLYFALPGYDLTTGWGSIDAYNYTMYFATHEPLLTPGDLSAVSAAFNLTGLQVTSSGAGAAFNASIQQNFFLANSLGAPIYWVQNVIYVNWTPGSPGHWAMNFSGWVVYPFYGLYPAATIYEYNYPLVGQSETTPLAFTVRTAVTNSTMYNGQHVVFSFGVNGASPVSLPVPGASYIIGDLWYNYSWGGVTYTNGPYPPGPAGGLSPQFGLVGGPSGGTGNFMSATGGNLQLEFQRFGSNAWVPGTTRMYDLTNTQTGETATNLLWTLVRPANQATGTPANWSLTYSSGSQNQGVLEYDAATVISKYVVSVKETGLASGVDYWEFVTALGQFAFTSGTEINISLPNGTFSWLVFTIDGLYRATPGSGTLLINGTGAQISVVFTLVTYSIVVNALGLGTGVGWNVTWNETFGARHSVPSTTPSIAFLLSNGSYELAFTGAANWSAHPGRMYITVFGAGVVEQVSFTPPLKFATTFLETGLPANTSWTLNVTGGGKNINTTLPTITLPLVNRTYSWSARTNISGWFAPGGRVIVNGSVQEVAVNFLPSLYLVQFSESGPAGSVLWGVQIQGGPYLSSLSPTLSWEAANGTYNYTVLSNLSGWTPTPSHGTLVVNGAGTNISVVFSRVSYSVTFVESGLPSGTQWGVSLGIAGSGTTQGVSVGFTVRNGSYAYTVTVPGGYAAVPSSGTLTVAGRDGSVSVTFEPVNTATGAGGPFGLGDLGYLLIGLIVVAAVLVVLILSRRPSRPAPVAAPTRPPTT